MKKIIPKLYTFLLPIILASCNDSSVPAPSTDVVLKTIALTNGQLIDGSGAGPISQSRVIIRKGHIVSVGTAASLDIPYGAEVIDLHEAYILPGFINAHIHSGYNEGNLKAWAKAGVTTVRDLGNLRSSPADGFAFKESMKSDHSNARLVAAGPLVTTVGGYGNYPVTSVSDAQAKTNGLIDAGADLIKIAIEDDLQQRNWSLLSMDEITTIVQTAHSRQRQVSAHISNFRHLDMAIKGGVDDVAHMVISRLPDMYIAAMIQQNMYWVPTLELWKGVSDYHSITWITTAQNNLLRFVQSGGSVALGTDYDGYVTPFDMGMPITEMKLMQEAGMTPMQIIVAGTMNAAHVCQLDDSLGTIVPGKIADIIVVKDNPLDNLEALLNIQLVIHDGEILTER